MAPDPPRPVTDLSGQQAGDQRFRDTAGENIYHGLDGATLLRLLEGQAHERELVAAAIERLSTQLRGHELMQAKRDEQETRQRTERQGVLDHRLTTQDADLAALRRGQTLARRWLAILTLLLILEIIVVAWLVDRELALLAARAVYDAVVAGRR